jgi:hypothetical protein
MVNFANNQTRCIMIVVIILLFYVAYKGYCKFKCGGAKSESEEEDTGGLIEKTKIKDGSKVEKGKDGKGDINFDLINRTVEDIMRKQI